MNAGGLLCVCVYIGFPCYPKIAEIPPLDFCWIANTGTNIGLLKKWKWHNKNFEKQGIMVDGKNTWYIGFYSIVYFSYVIFGASCL